MSIKRGEASFLNPFIGVCDETGTMHAVSSALGYLANVVPRDTIEKEESEGFYWIAESMRSALRFELNQSTDGLRSGVENGN